MTDVIDERFKQLTARLNVANRGVAQADAALTQHETLHENGTVHNCGHVWRTVALHHSTMAAVCAEIAEHLDNIEGILTS